MRPGPSWLALAALLLPACGLLGARLDARTACLDSPAVLVPGARGAGAVGLDLAYDVREALPVLDQPGTDARLALRTVEISAGAGGAQAVGGLDALTISVQAPLGSALPTAELVRYLRPAAPDPARIEAEAENDLDLVPYLSDGALHLQLQATGDLPDRPWMAAVRACFALEVRVDYAP